ncbi:hypothetical protein OIU84_017587 [Salix udensis]|nr:hypothetical protein OIU84_017587 [Salix udensis]
MNPKSWSRLLLYQSLKKPRKPPIPLLSRKISTFPHFPSTQTPSFSHFSKTHFSTFSGASSNVARELLAELEREKQKEREVRRRNGLDTKDIDAEDEEDYLGVGPLIEKIEKKIQKDAGKPEVYDHEAAESGSDDDSWFSTDASKKREELFLKKFGKHEELVKNFAKAETLDDAFKWMKKIDNFEQKHFRLRPEYRVIGDLINLLKVAEGKDKFILQHKLNRAMRLVEWKEAYDPNNPANYGFFQRAEVAPGGHALEDAESKKQKKKTPGDDESKEDEDDGGKEDEDEDEDEEDEFDDMKERDDILLEKLNEIDKKLEDKLAELDYTFGKKGKVLEEEIRNLAEQRNSLTEKKRRPMYRKGFDDKVINVNRTCKVTKGGRVFKYTAMLACGNYHGVIGFAKAKGPRVHVAIQKAREKCFQNLHYVERHEEHTIANAVQTQYKKTKLYLWPAPTRTGMKAGKTVMAILNLAGFKNVKSKVIGSRNPYNTVRALFKALNAIETPKDVQEKFGRTVVEKHLL